MTEPLGVAVIGTGHWGGHYVRLIGQVAGARPVVVCDTDPGKLVSIGQRFPGVRVTTDLADALADPAVHAAVICTPASTHAAVAQTCLAAGKHILVEKPITTRSEDAAALIDTAAAAGLVLMVGHTFLFNPSVLKVRELIRRPGLGKIHYLYSRRTNLGPIRRDVNAMWDLASHDVSIFNFMLEAVPEWVSAVGARVLNGRQEDVGFAALGYPHGVVAHIHVSWADPNKVREVVVVAANQRIVMNDMDPQESVRVFERGVEPHPTAPLNGAGGIDDFPMTLRDGDIISPRIEPSEPLRNQVEHFIECARSGRLPATDGAAGRDVVRVLEAIDRSIAENGAPKPVVPRRRAMNGGGRMRGALVARSPR
ncbi:MAG: Gfo/Idh/MocA family oxidoreductase [Thermoleophilia bacterium]|nr:Gfo/Idh/MocA family oxidoreductase [Thermoleophilia bacterium]